MTGYRVERCQGAGCGNFAQIATPVATSFNDTGLTAATSYSYRVRATDAAGNLSAYSNVASATTAGQQGQMYFIHPDHLNTPRMIANQSGATVWKWDQQEPFGATPPNDNPSGAGAFEFPLRFPGQYFDRETNLAYNYFRDYDSGIGRYLESDPIGLRGGINIYAYVNQSPLGYADPFALEGPLPLPVITPPTTTPILPIPIAPILLGGALLLHSGPAGTASDMLPSPGDIDRAANDPNFETCPPNCDFWRKWIRKLRRDILRLAGSPSVGSQQDAIRLTKSLNNLIDQFNKICFPPESKLDDMEKIHEYYSK